MKYMLVNKCNSQLSLDLVDAEPTDNNRKLNRPGNKISITLPKGGAVDILKYFDGSVEKAHKSVKHSRDVLKLFRPDALHMFVANDKGEELDPDLLLMGKSKKKTSKKKSSAKKKADKKKDPPKEEPKTEDNKEEPKSGGFLSTVASAFSGDPGDGDDQANTASSEGESDDK